MFNTFPLNITCFVITSDLLGHPGLPWHWLKTEENKMLDRVKTESGTWQHLVEPQLSALVLHGALPSPVYSGDSLTALTWWNYAWGRAYSHAWASEATCINDFKQKQQLLHPSEHRPICDEHLQGGREADELQGISYSNQAAGKCFGPDDPRGLYLDDVIKARTSVPYNTPCCIPGCLQHKTQHYQLKAERRLMGQHINGFLCLLSLLSQTHRP